MLSRPVPGAAYHPQVSLTDELGGEVTLISSRLSDSSTDTTQSSNEDSSTPSDMICEIMSYRDSAVHPFHVDLLPHVGSNINVGSNVLPSFVISGPCDPTRPSITRGIGKSPVHVATPHPFDSNRLEESNRNLPPAAPIPFGFSPRTGHRGTSPEGRRTSYRRGNNALRQTFPPPTAPTGNNVDYFSDDSLDESENPLALETMDVSYENVRNREEMALDSLEYTNMFTSELLQKSNSGSFEVTLSDFCSTLTSTDILGLVKRIIDVKAPPKGFLAFPAGEFEGGLALEYPGGIQIELRVTGEETKGLKLRRISGDQLQYSQLCHELISCMRV